jgi:hypothetical protein
MIMLKLTISHTIINNQDKATATYNLNITTTSKILRVVSGKTKIGAGSNRPSL